MKQALTNSLNELVQLAQKDDNIVYLTYDEINNHIPEELGANVLWMEQLFSELESCVIPLVNSKQEFFERANKLQNKKKQETATDNKQASKATKEKIPSHIDSIKRYFYEMAKSNLLSTDEERAAAEKIDALRYQQFDIVHKVPGHTQLLAERIESLIATPAERDNWIDPQSARSRSTLQSLKKMSASLGQQDLTAFWQEYHRLAMQQSLIDPEIKKTEEWYALSYQRVAKLLDQHMPQNTSRSFFVQSLLQEDTSVCDDKQLVAALADSICESAATIGISPLSLKRFRK